MPGVGPVVEHRGQTVGRPGEHVVAHDRDGHARRAGVLLGARVDQRRSGPRPRAASRSPTTCPRRAVRPRVRRVVGELDPLDRLVRGDVDVGGAGAHRRRELAGRGHRHEGIVGAAPDRVRVALLRGLGEGLRPPGARDHVLRPAVRSHAGGSSRPSRTAGMHRPDRTRRGGCRGSRAAAAGSPRPPRSRRGTTGSGARPRAGWRRHAGSACRSRWASSSTGRGRVAGPAEKLKVRSVMASRLSNLRRADRSTPGPVRRRACRPSGTGSARARPRRSPPRSAPSGRRDVPRAPRRSS